MKKLIALGVMASLALTAFGQGKVEFNNRNTTAGVSSPISILPAGGTSSLASGADTTIRAALLGGAVGSIPASFTTAGTLSMLASPTSGNTWVNFRTGAAAGFVSVGSDSARDSGLAYGSTGLFQVVAWQGNYTTWAAAFAAAQANPTSVLIGFSNPLTLKVTTSDTDLSVPALVGLQSFTITTVPEPSTFALAGLGAAALLIFRRRK